MQINIDTLLALPRKERRKIAERLWNSLSPVNAISKEDERVIALLEKRWQDVQSGKSKLYSSGEIKAMVKACGNQ